MAKHQSHSCRHKTGHYCTQRGQPGGRLTLGTALVVALVALTACGSNNNQNLTQADLGGVRVINAVADSPTLNFTLENSSIASLAYGQISGFSRTRDDRFDLDVLYSALDGTLNLIVDDFRTRVREREETTVVVAGTVAAPVTFEFGAPNPDIQTGSSEYHIINTSGSGTLDVYITAPGADLGSAVASVANNAVSPLIAAESGTRQLRLTTAGSSEVIYDSGQFELSSGRRLIFNIQPYFGPGTPTVTVANIEGTRVTGFANEQLPVSLRVANAIGDVAGADASVTLAGTATDYTDIASNSFSAPQLFDPGMAELSVSMQTDPGTIYFSDSQLLVAGEDRTLLVAGSFSDATITGRLIRNPQRILSTSAQLHMLQGTISPGRVDVYLLSDSNTTADVAPIIGNFALLANATREVIAGTYDVVVTQADSDTVLAGPETITLTNGSISTILLTDADGGGTPPRIIIEDQS